MFQKESFFQGIHDCHSKYMKRALTLAEKGSGYTNPNPLVGAVIVQEGEIIGEGYHHRYGGDHAEIEAIKNSTRELRGSTLYVNLEPCSHVGNTPPCTQAIIDAGIAQVVVSFADPNPKISGRGIEKMRSQGIHVITGVCEGESRRLNEIFLKYITTGMPFCIMKTAMTLDGKTASCTGDARWISSSASRATVHSLRQRIAAVMVGVNTVISDDPLLTTRLEDGRGNNPIRVIADSRGRTPLPSKVLQTAKSVHTIIAVTELASEERKNSFRETGAEVITIPSSCGQVDLPALMKTLGKKHIDSVLLEGGSQLNFSALASGVVDKVQAYIAPKIIGGTHAKTPVGGKGIPCLKDALILDDIAVSPCGDDWIIEGYLKR